jgi:glutaredoxin
MRCDQCKKDLGLDSSQERQYLEVRVFHNNKTERETDHLHFCSWRCCLKFIPKIKSDYFVNLPYLLYDEKKKGLGVDDFLEAIKSSPRKIEAINSSPRKRVRDTVCSSTHGDTTNV